MNSIHRQVLIEPMNGEPDRLLKVAEVQRLLGYSRATVYRLIGNKTLPVVRVAGTVRFRYQSILRWMADHETPEIGTPRIPTDFVRTEDA